MHVPNDPPDVCPSCGDGYESVSRHRDGFVVNLLDNDRYRRVCFHPATADCDVALDCYHHTHAEATDGDRSAIREGPTDDSDPEGDPSAVVPAERS